MSSPVDPALQLDVVREVFCSLPSRGPVRAQVAHEVPERLTRANHARRPLRTVLLDPVPLLGRPHLGTIAAGEFTDARWIHGHQPSGK